MNHNNVISCGVLLLSADDKNDNMYKDKNMIIKIIYYLCCDDFLRDHKILNCHQLLIKLSSAY